MPPVNHPPVLGGSMFEYLMMLVMPISTTPFDQTAHAAKRQIEYGHQRGVRGASPNRLQHGGRAFNYQYRAFGVPGLGLQRGLAEDR
jgi:hypothetical protein